MTVRVAVHRACSCAGIMRCHAAPQPTYCRCSQQLFSDGHIRSPLRGSATAQDRQPHKIQPLGFNHLDDRRRRRCSDLASAAARSATLSAMNSGLDALGASRASSRVWQPESTLPQVAERGSRERWERGGAERGGRDVAERGGREMWERGGSRERWRVEDELWRRGCCRAELPVTSTPAEVVWFQLRRLGGLVTAEACWRVLVPAEAFGRFGHR